MSWKRALLISLLVSLAITAVMSAATGSKAYGLFLLAPLIIAARRMKRRDSREQAPPDSTNNQPIHPK